MATTRGFQNNAKKIAKRQGIPMDRAQGILASGARKSSASARKKNPRLNRVAGMPPAPKKGSGKSSSKTRGSSASTKRGGRMTGTPTGKYKSGGRG